VAAIPGMLLLWLLWNKGYLAQSIRQPSTEDDGHAVSAEKT
jgi:PAT family beta-lactamase induction signal transducer AmpG